MKIRPLPFSFALLGAWLLFTDAFNPNNPPIARTGAPGESTCAASGCHSGGTFTGVVSLAGIPDTVTANQDYNVTLTNTSNATRAGFQLTCLDGATNYVGTLTNGAGTSIGNNTTTGRRYIRQSSPRTLMNGSTSWSFTWKAPAAAINNTCNFYFVSLCANGNGEKDGDNVLVATKQVVLRATTAAPTPEASAWIRFQKTGGQLDIQLVDVQTGRLELYDLNGKLVLNQPLQSDNLVQLETIPAGIYIAKISAGGRVASRKFMH